MPFTYVKHIIIKMVTLTLLFLMFTTRTVIGQSMLLPWESIVIPNDLNDEEDRRVSFDCYAQCFGLSPVSDVPKKGVANIQSHCLQTVKDVNVYKVGDTKMYVSDTYASWWTAYSKCRKYSMDLLGQDLTKFEDELNDKLQKYYKEGDEFWLGSNNLMENKFKWSDTATDIPTTGRIGKITGSGPNNCIQTRVSKGTLVMSGVKCSEYNRFICVMRKHCIAS